MKKSGFIFGAMLSGIFTSAIVSAAQALPAPPITLDGLRTFFSALLVGTYHGGEDVVSRLFIFLVLAVVLYKPSEKILGDDKSNLALFLSALVSLLAVRFFSPDMIQGLLLPYGALGIVLSIFLPFLLFGAFIVTSDITPSLRKLGWWLMTGIFCFLWWTRWSNIGDMAWIYLFAALLSLVAVWFDGTLRKWIFQGKVERSNVESRAIASEVAMQRLANLYELLAKATPQTKPAILREIKKYEQNLKDLAA